jgi:hypothetical protein
MIPFFEKKFLRIKSTFIFHWAVLSQKLHYITFSLRNFTKLRYFSVRMPRGHKDGF